jgi:hypothetical protein
LNATLEWLHEDMFGPYAYGALIQINHCLLALLVISVFGVPFFFGLAVSSAALCRMRFSR